MTQELIIDPEFQALIPPLAPDELAQLEANILAEGCRDPLVAWESTLIDGHNRYAICKRHNLFFHVLRKEFEDRDAVMDWMDRNQLGRRNLKPDQFTLLLGRCYNRQKKARDANLRQNAPKDQNDPSDEQSTAERLGQQFGVSAPTVKRAGKFAEAVEKLASIAPNIAASVTAGTSKPRKDVIKAAQLLESAPEKATAILVGAKTAAEFEKEAKLEALKAKVADNLKNDLGEIAPTIQLCDAMDWLAKQEPADLLLTDPPYSTDVDDVEAFANTWLPLALSKVKPTGRAFVCIGAYPKELAAYLAVAMPEQILVWTYRNTLGPSPRDNYKLNWQAILYYKGKDAPDLDCPVMLEQFSVQDINAPDGRLGDRYHAWQKPMELAERFIRHSTKPGDVVLDPFACTGTFILAAGKLGRTGKGCDFSRENLEIAKERGCHEI